MAPQPGEHVLEIGPGTGYYTLDVAEWISPGGTLEIFDLQPRMLQHTMQRALSRGLTNVIATEGNAQSLAYADSTMDAAYLVAVLGEIPDQAAALSEIARVLRPGGRLVVGELFGDPHWVSPRALRRGADGAGLEYVRRSGTALGYFAAFRKPRAATLS
jgi:ubiquinone/menaquinone biosynthesis C-methylase UbiE